MPKRGMNADGFGGETQRSIGSDSDHDSRGNRRETMSTEKTDSVARVQSPLLSKDEIWKVGREAGKRAPVGFESWEMFGRSFGFYQWKKKNELGDDEVEHFKQAFLSESTIGEV